MALFDDKKTFLKQLEMYGVMGLSKKYGVTHGAIMYYKRKWDKNRKVKSEMEFAVNDNVVTVTDVYGRKFLIDFDDTDKVASRKWCVHQGYVKTAGENKTLLLHRVIMDCPNGMVVDHINHDKSDNRKVNLRLATRAQNIQNRGIIPNNTSGVTGVHWHEHTKKWKVEIEVNAKKHYIGVFREKEDAIAARKEAEEKYFGEYTFKQ